MNISQITELHTLRVNFIICESYLNKDIKFLIKLMILIFGTLCGVLFGFSTFIYNICLRLAPPQLFRGPIESDMTTGLLANCPPAHSEIKLAFGQHSFKKGSFCLSVVDGSNTSNSMGSPTLSPTCTLCPNIERTFTISA